MSGSSGTSAPGRRRVAACRGAIDFLKRLKRVGLLRRLVATIALDAREPQRESAGILRTLLKIVEGDLDDQLGTHEDDVAFAPPHPAFS